MKNKTKTGKLSAATITFYVIAVLFLIYTGYALYNSYTIVAEAIDYGSVTYAENWKEILAVYVQNVLPYLAYTVIIYGIGYLIDKAQTVVNALSTETTSVDVSYKEETVDEDDDDAFIASLTSQVKETPASVSTDTKEDAAVKEDKPAEVKAEAIETVSADNKEEVKEDKNVETAASDEKKEDKKPAAKKSAAKKTTAKKTSAKEKTESKKSESK